MKHEYPNWCFECEVNTYTPDGEYSNAEAEVRMIEHLEWYHSDEETVKAKWASLAADISVISGMVVNDLWFEAYVESADIYDRVLLAIRGVRKFSGMMVD